MGEAGEGYGSPEKCVSPDRGAVVLKKDCPICGDRFAVSAGRGCLSAGFRSASLRSAHPAERQSP